MTVKAKLSVTLRADDVDVATSEDADLWQQILLAISGSRLLSTVAAAGSTDPAASQRAGTLGITEPAAGNDALARLAAILDIEARVLEGACAPSSEAPFMALDAHRYEAMRKALPERGGKAISNIQIAGTLLSLWFYYAGLGNVTQAQAQALLDPLGKRDPNPGRGISNAHWLQARSGGQFAVNPAEITVATTIARCFCTKDWAAHLKNSE